MKYDRDETNYEDDVYEQADYEILSKFNKKKLAREEAEKPKAAENCCPNTLMTGGYPRMGYSGGG